jgi:hypothetical protein
LVGFGQRGGQALHARVWALARVGFQNKISRAAAGGGGGAENFVRKHKSKQ